MSKAPKPHEIARNYLAFGDTRAGKAVLADLCVRFHLMSPLYAEGDPYETARREGERNVVLYILSQMKWGAMDLTKLALRGDDDA